MAGGKDHPVGHPCVRDKIPAYLRTASYLKKNPSGDISTFTESWSTPAALKRNT